MSLACFECKRIGSFNTLILFSKSGKFEKKNPTSHYGNFYTCCASFDSFKPVQKSRFAVFQQKEYDDSWLTGDDGPFLKEGKFKQISEDELKKRLPNIYKGLAGGKI